MKLPRVRFTVRRMIVMVAISGMLFGIGIEGLRWNRTRKLALKWAATCDYNVRLNRQRAAVWQASLVKLQKEASEMAGEFREGHLFDETLAKSRKDYNYKIELYNNEENFYGLMKQRLSHVASHPWLPLPTDELRSHISPLEVSLFPPETFDPSQP
jgi:hypothetical protein